MGIVGRHEVLVVHDPEFYEERLSGDMFWQAAAL